jgi:hypothetical protein
MRFGTVRTRTVRTIGGQRNHGIPSFRLGLPLARSLGHALAETARPKRASFAVHAALLSMA